MMTTVHDIYRYIDTFAPFESAMDFDNCGILAGSGSALVQTALVALDITNSVAQEAVEKGAQLIISHHPVIFHPLKALRFDSPLCLLVQNHIGALCAHTNLDLSVKGVNTCLAQSLSLQGITPVQNEPMATGKLIQPLSTTAFAAYVKEKLGCKGVRFTGGQKQIQTVAVSSGAGGSCLYTALELGADAFVTGEVKHSEILDAVANGLCIVDAGHFKTEQVVIQPLIQLLARRFPGIDFLPAERCTDTIAYL